MEEEPPDDDDDGTPPGDGADMPPDGGDPDGSETANKGTLIIDASCAPADIAYPTDLELCDKARKWTEAILDHY